jgi:TorA maturation chaperone TorD
MGIREVLETRAHLYSFLSRVFLEEPPREMIKDIVSGNFPIPYSLGSLNEELEKGIKMLGDFIENAEKNEDALLDQLTCEYTDLFIGPSRDIILPYESGYTKMAEKTIPDVKKMYKKAGIMKSNEVHEREDHIALELEYMSYLCWKELEALDKGDTALELLEIQKDFMEKHLTNWTPNFCNDILKSKKAIFYKSIALITKGFLDFDKNLIEELKGYMD